MSLSKQKEKLNELPLQVLIRERITKSDMKEIWATTEDNPFDPFTQWDRWANYDYQMGYNTCGKLARMAACSDNLTDVENDSRIDHAINDLCENGFVVLPDGSGVSHYCLAVKGKTVAW